MARYRIRTRGFFYAFSIILFLSFSHSTLAQSPALSDLNTILKQIENRHYRWVAFRSDVILFFVAQESAGQAMCGGELLYDRLQERLLLSCYDTEKNPVFVFRTLDRRFDLYLPAQQTLYRGSIFDLEDSPEVESHLKLIDLYRALKPGMFDPSKTAIDASSGGVTVSLNVSGNAPQGPYLARKLYVTAQGDVIGELFFDPKGQTLTEIQRYDFTEIPEHVGGFQSVVFPKKITIISPKTGRNTAIFFSNIKPLDAVSSYQFLLRIPKGTKEVFLKEVDPKFTYMALETEKVLTATTAQPTFPKTELKKPGGIPAQDDNKQTLEIDVTAD